MPTNYRRLRGFAKRHGLRRVADLAARREPWHSNWEAIGFARDLAVSFAAPDAKIPIEIRPLDAALAARMFVLDDPATSADELELRRSRGELFAAGIGTGYVAVTDDGEPAYCQWLIGPEFNAAIDEFFDGVFPELEPGTALLEGAFTPEAHRGKGIMPAAMARIAEHGHDIGADRVITFVTTDNIPSIKGCERSGFAPYTTRNVIWNGLKRRVEFESS
jgi:GNAT superfamily N-acetyltransferase